LTFFVQRTIYLLVLSIRNYLVIKIATDNETRCANTFFIHRVTFLRNIFFKNIILLVFIEMEVNRNTHKKYIYMCIK